MSWNPCGRLVDWARRPFDCDARPFRDSDTVARIRFYPVAKDAQAIEFPSNIYVNSWDDDQDKLNQTFPGCVGDGSARNNLTKPIPGTGKGHYCGTREDFTEGGLYDPDAPPVEYTTLGLPRCCPPNLVGRGGAGVGGAGIPALVTGPGHTCPTAGLMPLGVTVSGYLPDLTVQDWWRSELTPGASYKITASVDALFQNGNLVAFDTDCSTVLFTPGNFGEPPNPVLVFPFTAPSSGEVRWRVLPVAGRNPAGYHLRVDPV